MQNRLGRRVCKRRRSRRGKRHAGGNGFGAEGNAREDIKTIETARCRVALLTGEFDYSCTPAMTEAVAAAIKGAHYTLMKDMGHFPMIENYPEFRPFLIGALDHVTANTPQETAQ